MLERGNNSFLFYYLLGRNILKLSQKTYDSYYERVQKHIDVCTVNNCNLEKKKKWILQGTMFILSNSYI